jgi:hypothetical protein
LIRVNSTGLLVTRILMPFRSPGSLTGRALLPSAREPPTEKSPVDAKAGLREGLLGDFVVEPAGRQLVAFSRSLKM